MHLSFNLATQLDYTWASPLIGTHLRHSAHAISPRARLSSWSLADMTSGPASRRRLGASVGRLTSGGISGGWREAWCALGGEQQASKQVRGLRPRSCSVIVVSSPVDRRFLPREPSGSLASNGVDATATETLPRQFRQTRLRMFSYISVGPGMLSDHTGHENEVGKLQTWQQHSRDAHGPL